MEELFEFAETVSAGIILFWLIGIIIIIAMIIKFFQIASDCCEMRNMIANIEKTNEIIIKQNNQTNTLLMNAEKKNNTVD